MTRTATRLPPQIPTASQSPDVHAAEPGRDRSYSGPRPTQLPTAMTPTADMTAMSDATGTSSYAYDPFGELTSATNGTGQATGYGYNADGDVTCITYPLPSPPPGRPRNCQLHLRPRRPSSPRSPTSTATRSPSPTTPTASRLPGARHRPATPSTPPTTTPIPRRDHLKNSTTRCSPSAIPTPPPGNVLSETDTRPRPSPRPPTPTTPRAGSPP